MFSLNSDSRESQSLTFFFSFWRKARLQNQYVPTLVFIFITFFPPTYKMQKPIQEDNLLSNLGLSRFKSFIIFTDHVRSCRRDA